MPNQMRGRGLLSGATSTALLAVAGLWWSLGSFSAPCVTSGSKAPDGALTTVRRCSDALSHYEVDGLLGVLPSALPAVLALIAFSLTPFARLRAPLRWVVAGSVLVLALLTVFTQFMLLLIPAGALMVLSAIRADVRPAPEEAVRTSQG
jgi:hypothetical protein